MKQGNDSRHRVTVWMRWIARIWSFPIIVYALLTFAGYTWNWVTTGVADPHAVENYPPVEVLPPILLFLSILGLGIAWRWERWGGTIAAGFQLATLLVLPIHRPIAQDFPRSAAPYFLVLIVAVPGILFLVCWWRSKGTAIPDAGDGKVYTRLIARMLGWKEENGGE